MNPEVKQKWTSALLSDEYPQGKEALYREGKFCCLGVLCDLYSKEHPEVEWRKEGRLDKRGVFLGQIDFLPKEVSEWAGLTDRDPKVHLGYEVYKSLSDLNDGGNSFKEIANIIEKQL